jgi:Conserved TM helix/Mechanosensitive ion channel
MGLEILRSLLLKFTSTIPNIVGAIVIAIIGMILARAISKLVERLLVAVNIDKLAEKLSDIDVIQDNNINLKPSTIISQIIYYLLLLIFLIMATDILQMSVVSQLIKDLISYIPSLVTAMLLIIIGLVIANVLKNIVVSVCKSIGIPSSNLIGNFIFYFVFLTALITALSQAKIDTDFIKNNISILLGGGVAAFAIGYGLASKDMMSNFLASFYSRRHFSVGDTVKIGETIGKIVYADNSCVKIQSAEKLVIIPLHKLMKEDVEILPSDFIKIPENL